MPGRAGLRHRRHPARRRPAPEHPGRGIHPRYRAGAAGHAAGTGPAGTGPSGPAGRPGPAWPAGAAARTTGYGALLTARQVLALACRAEISLIRWRDGLPLDVGRRYRTETPALRRALEARDQGCRGPGCGIPAAWCTAHHLTPWSQGGTTSLDTTALFCFTHHQVFIHQLGWTITGSPNATLHFTHPGGWLTLDSPLPAQAKPRAPSPVELGSSNGPGSMKACPSRAWTWAG